MSWRGLRAVGPIQWSAAAPWRAARVAVGVLVPLAIGSATGHLSYGAFAALGALPAGFASFQGVARTRLAAVSMASLGIAISTFVGATTAAIAPWLLVAVVTVWGYLIGLAVSLGQRLSVATLQCGAGLTVAVGMPLGPGPAGARAGFALAGGVLQGLLVAGSWIVRPGDTERKAIADAYLALAAYAREVANGSTETPSAVEFSAAAVLKDPNPLLREATQLQLLDLLEEAERVRASLAALAAEMGSAGPDANARLRRLTAAAAATLSLVAATLTTRRHDRAERAGELTRQVGAVIVPAGPGVRASSDALSGQLRAIARIVVDVADGPPARDRPGSAPDASRPRGRDRGAVGATLRANVSLSSEAGRHAVRMAAIAGVAEVMVLATGLSEGRWVVLTLFIVLKPDYGSTVSRSVQRAVGTALGVGLGVAAVQFGRLGQWELVTIAGVAVAAAYALFDVAYLLYGVFLSAFIVVLLAILGTPAVPTATSRLADTAIGAALAVIAYLVWPTWEAASARDTFAALLEAHGAYATALLRELAHPGQLRAGRLRRLQVTAQRARSDAEASAARLSEEPPQDPVTPQLARRLVATVRRLTQAELAAHTLITLQHVPEGLEDEIVPGDCSVLLDRLASMVATAMSAIAGSLRSMEPTAAVVDLRQTQAQLASRAAAAAPALASATDGLVDAVDTLDSILRDYVKSSRPLGPSDHLRDGAYRTSCDSPQKPVVAAWSVPANTAGRHEATIREHNMASTTAPAHLPALGTHQRQEIGNELQATLVELIDLALVGKQLHWSVVGQSFRSLHLQLDELIDVWRDLADTVAERAVAIGFWPDGQADAVSGATETHHLERGAVEDQAVVRELVRRLAESDERMRARMDRLGELDLASQDVVIEVVRALEQQLWMVRTQLRNGR